MPSTGSVSASPPSLIPARHRLKAQLVGVAMLAGVALSGATQAQEAAEIVYRSAVLERTAGQPDIYRVTFEPCDLEGRFRLILDNGVEGGRRVSSGTVWLNGTPVILPQDLNQQVSQVVRPVSLRPTNTLEVSLAGAPGGRVRITVDGYMHCLRVRITAPLSGSVLHEPATLVEGEVESRGTAGVRLRVSLPIRGQSLDLFVPAEVHGRRFAAWVPLAPGAVRFVALASDNTGRTAEDAISVTFEPDPPGSDRPSRPDVSPTVGFAPLTVTFGGHAATNPDVDLLDLDVDGDGRPDFQLADFANPPHEVTYTYQLEGLYVATLVIREGTTGLTFTSRVPINVIPLPDLPVVWNGFRAALGRGDVEAALRLVADEARDRYRRVLEDLRADLPAIAAALQDATPLVVRPGYATASTQRVRGGQPEGFIVHFVRDADGVWRIASM